MQEQKSLSIFKLINTYFFKNKIGLIFSVVFPFIFMVIFFVIGKYVEDETITLISGEKVVKSGLNYFVNSFPAFITLTICPLSMLSLPIMNIEFRNSILLKKIKSSNVSKFEYNAIVFGYFILMSTVATIITLSSFFLFLIGNFKLINFFNWPTIIFGILSLMIVTITFSMFTSTFIKSGFSCQILNVGIILISLALSGQFIPITLLAKVKILKYMNLFSPIGYSQTTINIGTGQVFNGTMNNILIHSTNNVFDWTTDFYYLQYSLKIKPEQLLNLNVELPFRAIGIKVYEKWEKVTAVICPFILSAIFASIASYFFKWSNR